MRITIDRLTESQQVTVENSPDGTTYIHTPNKMTASDIGRVIKEIIKYFLKQKGA